MLILTAAQHGSDDAGPHGQIPGTGHDQEVRNRRLYDPDAGRYVTVADLAAMAQEYEDFVVYEAETGEDVTRSVLKQIIIERA